MILRFLGLFLPSKIARPNQSFEEPIDEGDYQSDEYHLINVFHYDLMETNYFQYQTRTDTKRQKGYN